MKETIVKINKTESCFSEKINKIDKPFVSLIRKKREESTKLGMKKERLQQTMQKYKGLKETFMNLKEMDRFLEKFNLPSVNQEEMEIMNNTTTSTEIEAVVKTLPKNKSPGPDGFIGEFYQTFREELMHVFLKLSKNCRGRNTSKLI